MESSALGGLSRLLFHGPGNRSREPQSVAPRPYWRRCIPLSLFRTICPPEPSGYFSHRRDGAAGPAVSTYQFRSVHVLHLRGGHAAVLRRDPNCCGDRIGHDWRHWPHRADRAPRQRLGSFLLLTFSDDHRCGQYVLRRTQPHESQIAQGERRDREPRQGRRARAHCARLARRSGTHAIGDHPEIRTCWQVDRPRSATGGQRNPRGRADLAAGPVRCARRDSRVPFPGSGSGTGPGQVHAGTRRTYGAVRCRDHGQTPRHTGERAVPCRSRGCDQRGAPRAGSQLSHAPGTTERYLPPGNSRRRPRHVQRRRQWIARHARTSRNDWRNAESQYRGRHDFDHYPAPERNRVAERRQWRLNPSNKEGRKTIRVVLAEDQGMVLGALAALLEIEGDISVVAKAANGKEALEAGLAHKPDVFITDIEMPHMSGLDVAAELKRRKTGTRVVIVTTFAGSGYLRRALEAGASGYLLKDMRAEELADAVRRVHQGLRVIHPELATEAWSEMDPLTDRERQVLRLAGEGMASGDIAGELGLSDGTVRNYLSEAISKLGASNRVEAARIARTKGWL